MAEFRMPSLGADMEAGTLLEWRVKPGDRVKRGDIIAVVDTEKAAIEVEVFEDGVINALLVPPGQKVPVGTALATLHDGGQPEPTTLPLPREERACSREGAAGPGLAAPEAAPAPTPAPSSLPSARLRVSPLARKLAGAMGVDLSHVKGTGPGGAISKEDIEKAAAVAQAAKASAPAVPAPGPVAPAPSAAISPTAERYAAMRQAIAAAMSRSKREIPHYYLQTSIDMKPALEWLEAENLKRPVAERLLSAVLLLKAVAVAAREVPEMNGFWRERTFQPSEGVHVGVAISLRHGGLIAPAIHDTDLKCLDELMRDLRDLVSRARAGTLRSSEMSDPTLTLTNLGEQGVEAGFGVIYPPQVALVGFGKIAERPWAVGGMLGVRPIITATLSADHRASDGHRGGLFLAAIDRLLQEPEKL
jgi:pyruvate dehydrogenase E2 component (dihydrolipoyllysine-residue acetyltransferase)